MNRASPPRARASELLLLVLAVVPAAAVAVPLRAMVGAPLWQPMLALAMAVLVAGGLRWAAGVLVALVGSTLVLTRPDLPATVVLLAGVVTTSLYLLAIRASRLDRVESASDPALPSRIVVAGPIAAVLVAGLGALPFAFTEDPGPMPILDFVATFAVGQLSAVLTILPLALVVLWRPRGVRLLGPSSAKSLLLGGVGASALVGVALGAHPVVFLAALPAVLAALRTSPVDAALALFALGTLTAAGLGLGGARPATAVAMQAAVAGLAMVGLTGWSWSLRAEAAEAALRHREQQHLAVLQTLADAVLIVGQDGMVSAANPAAQSLMGLRVRELLGRPPTNPAVRWTDVDGRALLPGSNDPVARALEERTSVTGLVLGLSGGGRMTPAFASVDVQIMPPSLQDDSLMAAVTLVDVTAQVFAEKSAAAEQTMMRHRALYDSLTGLPNRSMLIDRVDHARERAWRQGTATAALAIDLDGFKATNDVLGHEAGDEVLVQVAVRLKSALRATDTPSRTGGDEFVVLCEDIDPDDVAGQVAAITDRVTAALDGPYLTSAGTTTVGASIGVAIADSPDQVTGELLARADQMMLARKRRGREERTAPVDPCPSLFDAAGAEEGGGITVMVVDDDPAMRLLAARVLTMDGDTFRVVAEAEGSEDTVARILSLRPDLVVCDMMMPGMSGLEVLRRVREEHPGQRFLFWSAAHTADLDRHSRQHGVAYVSKDHIELLAEAALVAAGSKVE